MIGNSAFGLALSTDGRLLPPRPPRPRKHGDSILHAVAYLLPAGMLLAVLAVSSLLVLRLSFGEKGAEWTAWTTGSYVQLADRLYLGSILLTFRLALVSTLIVALAAMPVAGVLARATSAMARRILLTLILLPLLVNLLVQSYGWLIILAPNGIVNGWLRDAGLIDRPVMFLFSETGVLLGLVQTSFPFAVLPIASAMRAIPQSFYEASEILGAGRWQRFIRITLPLCLPGVISASLLVFAYNASSFVIPFLLGGRRVSMLAVLIRDQIGPLLNWPLASASAVVLIGATLLTLLVYQRLLGRRRFT